MLLLYNAIFLNSSIHNTFLGTPLTSDDELNFVELNFVELNFVDILCKQQV